MAAKQLPSQEVLRQLLRYEPETGKLFWKERGPELFGETSGRSAAHSAKIWNMRFAGREAFTADCGGGYKGGRIFEAGYLAHRVIFKLMAGIDPDDIDHNDGNRSNNRWANLSDVDRSKNQRNKAMSNRNTSGIVGVRWHKAYGKWVARIGCDVGREIHLGYFANLSDAAAARKAAEKKYGYSKRHGASPDVELR
jgi:hypothetical protein